MKAIDTQAAIKTHLSQPGGIGAFDGQQGIPLAISSVMADAAMSSAIACTDASDDASAMTGRDNGASARPAIIKTASNRRMAKLRFTGLDSHKWAAMQSSSFLHTTSFAPPALIGIKLPNARQA